MMTSYVVETTITVAWSVKRCCCAWHLISSVVTLAHGSSPSYCVTPYSLLFNFMWVEENRNLSYYERLLSSHVISSCHC